MKHHSKPHRSKSQILAEMKLVSKTRRMADRTPWSMLQVITSYALMQTEGFKAQRLLQVSNGVNAYEDKWYKYEIEVKPYEDRLFRKGGFKVTPTIRTEADIVARNGYERQVGMLEVDARNRMNEQSSRYYTWFYNVLIDMGFGEKRLNRVETYTEEMMQRYDADHSELNRWQSELLTDGKFMADLPVDPLTGEKYLLKVGG